MGRSMDYRLQRSRAGIGSLTSSSEAWVEECSLGVTVLTGKSGYVRQAAVDLSHDKQIIVGGGFCQMTFGT